MILSTLAFVVYADLLAIGDFRGCTTHCNHSPHSIIRGFMISIQLWASNCLSATSHSQLALSVICVAEAANLFVSWFRSQITRNVFGDHV